MSSRSRKKPAKSGSSRAGSSTPKAERKLESVTLDELKAMQERGEIKPPRDDAPVYGVTPGFWENARPYAPPEKISVHLRVDGDVLTWFKSQGPGHLTRMNRVLRSYYEAIRDKPKAARKKA